MTPKGGKKPSPVIIDPNCDPVILSLYYQHLEAIAAEEWDNDNWIRLGEAYNQRIAELR